MRKVIERLYYCIVMLSGVSIITFNCTTLYKTRSPKKIEELNQEIVPLRESVLTIPDFNGMDTLPIIYFETRGGCGSLTTHVIYNNGKYEFGQIERGIFITEYMEVSDIKYLISRLNEMGFFRISNESIQKKKFIEYRGCCLGLFFGGTPNEPVQTDATTYTVKIELSEIKHTISYYGIVYHIEIYPTLQDLKILWTGVKFIEDFLAQKRREEIYN
jgi:hypothetical protein